MEVPGPKPTKIRKTDSEIKTQHFKFKKKSLSNLNHPNHFGRTVFGHACKKTTL